MCKDWVAFHKVVNLNSEDLADAEPGRVFCGRRKFFEFAKNEFKMHIERMKSIYFSCFFLLLFSYYVLNS